MRKPQGLVGEMSTETQDERKRPVSHSRTGSPSEKGISGNKDWIFPKRKKASEGPVGGTGPRHPKSSKNL
jgi:hypothetical protein